MIIQLNTPFILPAHGRRPERTFMEVKIIDWDPRPEARELTIFAQYGNTVDGVWIGAQNVAVDPVIFEDRGPHTGAGGIEIDEDLAYSDLVNGALVPPGAAGRPVFNVVMRALYTALIVRVPAFAGTVV
ncbi:MAG: hypothetical protein GY769_20035 [bacterium]|nr:hypothetical protein [bacterium]